MGWMVLKNVLRAPGAAPKLCEAERHEAAKERRRRQKRASSIAAFLPSFSPNFHLSKVQWGVRIRNRTLQSPMSMQELTISLPKSSLREISHQSDR